MSGMNVVIKAFLSTEPWNNIRARVMGKEALLTLLPGSIFCKRDTDVNNRLLDSVGEGEGGMI